MGLGVRRCCSLNRSREHGAVTLGLNVFGFNSIARSLYRSLGYEESAVQMRKKL